MAIYMYLIHKQAQNPHLTQTSTLILPTHNSKLYCRVPTVVISFIIVCVTYRPMSHCAALNRLINRVIEIEYWGCVYLSVSLSGSKCGQICKQRKSGVTRSGREELCQQSQTHYTTESQYIAQPKC